MIEETLRRCLLYMLSIVVAAASVAAESDGAPGKPAPSPEQAIQARIAAYEAAPLAKRPADIARYIYNGSPAWLIYSPCCDHYHYLYDASGKALCAPMGGFVGAGDGKCRGVLTREGSEQNMLSPAPQDPK